MLKTLVVVGIEVYPGARGIGEAAGHAGCQGGGAGVRFGVPSGYGHIVRLAKNCKQGAPVLWSRSSSTSTFI